MIADSFKMRTIVGLAFCALLLSNGITMVESTVCSSVDTALKFSQCLIDKMSGSPFFTLDDRNNMIEVRDVLAQALLKSDQTKLPAKILITAFITSLADVIIHDDSQRNADRKQLYSSSLKECSLWSVGYEDVEIINEAQKILAILEQNRGMTHEEIRGNSGVENPAVGKFGSFSHPQIPGVNNPFPVQPSPVQPPSGQPQRFFSNDKTVFDQQQKPHAPAVVSSSRVNFNSQYSVQSSSPVDLSSSFGTRMQIQSGKPPQTFNLPSISQTEGSFFSRFASNLQNRNRPIGSEASEASQFEKGIRGSYPEKIPFSHDTGRIPESSVSQQDASSFSESQQTRHVGDASQVYNGGLTIPQVKESTVIAIPPNTDQQHTSQEMQNQQHGIEKEMPQTPIVENSKPEISPSVTNTQSQNQYSDATSYPTLESIIFNILTNSRTFRDTFNSEISQENAINLARTLTEHTFADSDLNMKNDALYIVTNEVAKVTVPTPENFALALSNALVFILRRYDTSLSANHSQVATNFLSNLDNSRQFYPQPGTTEKQSEDYYTPETPEQYYTQTESTEKQSQDYYTSETPGEFYPGPEIIQNPLQDYSAGEIPYSEFGERQRDFDFQSPPLSPEDRKDEMFSLSLAEYLSKSEAIRNFFCDGNVPEDKIQISFSIIKSSLVDYGPHVPSIAASLASGALSELYKEGLCNNYAQTISEIIAETLEENGVENASAENIASKMELNVLQRQIPPTEPPRAKAESFAASISKTETYSDVPELEPSLTYVEEINPHPQKTENLNPITSTDTQNAANNEYSSTITSQQGLTTSSTAGPEDWAPDGAIDQEALADYLAEKFEVLESYGLKGSEEEYENAEESEEEYENTEESEEESENTEESPSTVETSSDKYEEDGGNYDPTTTESEDKTFYQEDKGEILQEDKSYTYSTESNGQNSTVELQPSFHEPAPSSEDSSAGLQPGTISPSTVFARQVLETAESSIAYIRSPNFDLNNLCGQINQLAPLVKIPALDQCEPIAAIDYLLNVMLGVVIKLNGA